MTMALENNIDYSAIIKHEMLRRDLAWKGNERMIAIGHHYAFTLYFSIRSHDALPLTKHFHVKLLILAGQNPRRWGVWVTS